MVNEKPIITSFKDLQVYQRTYSAMLRVHRELLPGLPFSEKYDLKDQLSRSSKAIPRLIAEGYGKRYQKAGFQKYLVDAIGECNETIVSIEQCKDLYGAKPEICDELIKVYDISSRQLYKLAEAWDNFKNNPLPH